MRAELQAYLDGELSLDELPAELRAEAEAWTGVLPEPGAGGPAAPPWLESRVMAEIARVEGRAPAWRRALDWLIRPRELRVSPLAGALVAAALALLLVAPWRSGPAPVAAPEGAVFVQFVLDAPGAGTVAVAGDFSGWRPEHVLEDLDGDGVWTGRIPLEPGVHQYMFVVDGSTWVTDPRAERYADDGFGKPNAVLVVTEPAEA